MPITYSPLLNGESDVAGTYENLRYELLLSIEESGVPKNSTYSDHVGIPTIGVGFNMRNSSNLIEVVREVLGDITWEPSDSPENTALMNDLASIFSRNWLGHVRSEEHTSELQSLMRISYAVLCLKKKKNKLYTLT